MRLAYFPTYTGVSVFCNPVVSRTIDLTNMDRLWQQACSEAEHSYTIVNYNLTWFETMGAWNPHLTCSVWPMYAQKTNIMHKLLERRMSRFSWWAHWLSSGTSITHVETAFVLTNLEWSRCERHRDTKRISIHQTLTKARIVFLDKQPTFDISFF